MSTPKPGSIYEVAALAGVSRSTVSRVLNDPAAAPVKTRERVLQAAQQIGYRPSPAARALKSGRSDSIALIVGDLEQPYFSSLAKGIEAAADARNLVLMLLDAGRDTKQLARLLDRVGPWALTGLIIAMTNDIDTPSIRRRLEGLTQSNTHVVTATQQLPYTGIRSVLVDNADAAFRATERLHVGGARRIALVQGTDGTPYSDAMLRGFIHAHATSDRNAAAQRVVHGQFDPNRTATEVERLMASESAPDAWVCVSTYGALGVLAALRPLELLDTPVICCEDVPLLDHISPPIPSFGIDFMQYGTMLVDAVSPIGKLTPPLTQTIQAVFHDRGDHPARISCRIAALGDR